MGRKSIFHRTTLLAATLAATRSFATAQQEKNNDESQVYLPIVAPGKSNPQDPGTEAWELFEKAEANSSRSLDFDGSSWFTSTAGDEEEDELEGVRKWTWRVSISDFAVPNARSQFPDELGPLVDPHVVNTVHELEWEGDEDLSEALGGTDEPFCVAYFHGDFPANVTNKITDETGKNSYCGPALGEACVRALKKDGRIQSGCSGTKRPWFSLPECADTVGAVLRPAQIGTSTIANGKNSKNDTNTNSTSTVSKTFRDSGDGFLSISSAAFNGSDRETYYNATNRLQIVMLQANHPESGSLNSEPKLLCMRVNTTELPEPAEEGEAEGEGDGDGENMGFGLRASIGATFTAAFAVAAGLALL